MIEQKNKLKLLFKENKFFIILLVLILLLRMFIFELSFIKWHSMLPTFKGGEFVFINKAIAFDRDLIKKGDIVIIDDKKDDIKIIKRVVWLEWDKIKIDDWKVYVNWILKRTLLNDFLKWIKKEFIVWKGKLFYLGDNDLNSSDSRVLLFDKNYINWTIPIDNIIWTYSFTIIK